MTNHASWISRAKTISTLWLFVVGGISLVLVANWHLVHVAIVSQPGCIAHLKLGESATGDGRFSAAESSCSPN